MRSPAELNVVALQDLKVLEVRVTEAVLTWPARLSSPYGSLNMFKYCTSLSELHANVLDAYFLDSIGSIPSLKHLHVFKSFGEDTSRDDTKLVIFFAQLLCHRNLQSVVVSDLNAGKILPKTERFCNEAGVKYTVIRG